MEKLQGFIKNYFSLLNLSKMPEAVKNHLDSLMDKNDFPNKSVEGWTSDKFMDTSTKKWNDLPAFDEATLSDVEINILFRDLLETFTRMSGHAGTLDDKAKKFLDKYYGPGKLFNVPEISSGDKLQIKAFLELLFSNDKDIEDANIVEYDESQVLFDALNGFQQLDAPNVKSAISRVIQRIKNYRNQGWLSNEAAQKLFQANGQFNLNTIQNALQTNIEPTSDDLKKLRENAGAIFETLFKESKVYDAFKKYEPNDKILSEQIDSAISNTDYTGKVNADNYIAPKYKAGRKNITQYTQELADDFKSAMKKYTTAHRDNVFLKPTSKAIFEALDKEGLKTTDGLTTIIDKSSGIVDKLRGKEPFKAADHMKWMLEKLKNYQNNGLGKEIDGALRWGYQMNRIVNELITEAAKEGKIEEAKTALEVLSVMQYGTFTSRTMDAVNATDFNLFGDKDLSWNKNPGIQMVTGALDKTIKFGIQATGYAVTGLYNRARKMGGQIKSNKSKFAQELRKMALSRDTELAQQRINDENAKITADTEDSQTINDKDAILSRISGIVDDSNADAVQAQIKQHEQEIINKKKIMRDKLNIMRDKEKSYNEYQEHKQKYHQIANVDSEITTIQSDMSQLINDINAKRAEIAAKPYIDTITGATIDSDSAEEKMHEQKLAGELDNLKQKYLDMNAKLQQLYNVQANKRALLANETNEMNTRHTDAVEYLNASNDFNAAEADVKDLINDPDYKTKEKAFQEYSDATSAKEKAQKDISNRQEEWDKWNEKNKNAYTELMAYWDFLQTGKTKNLFHFSTKKLQKKMDENGELQNLLAQYTQSYRA